MVSVSFLGSQPCNWGGGGGRTWQDPCSSFSPRKLALGDLTLELLPRSPRRSPSLWHCGLAVQVWGQGLLWLWFSLLWLLANCEQQLL